MKTCTKCGIARPLSAFARRKTARGTLQSWCRECHKAHAAQRYARFTPEQVASKNETTRRLKREHRERVWAHLAGQRCIDCGERDVVVLEFDHRASKRDNVADLVSSGAPWSVIAAEIAACEVRCANCHRRKTAERRIAGVALITATRTQRPGARGAPGRRPDPLPALDDDSGAFSLMCQRCHGIFPATAFAWRSRERGLRQPWCRSCHNSHKRMTYGSNRSRETARTALRRLRLISENVPRLREHLEHHPCVDCGERDPIVLEFDHLRDKRADVTRLLWSGLLWTQLELEIAKCEIRCANCHRRRTARQRGFDQRKRSSCGASGPATPDGLEPPTSSSVAKRSIH